MFSFTIDNPRNIVRIKITGTIHPQDAEAFHSDMEQTVPKLKKGFKILTDMTRLKKMDTDAHTVIGKTMDLFNQYGVSKIVRVIPSDEKDIGFNILSLFHYSDHVVIHTHKTLEEAERDLDLKG